MTPCDNGNAVVAWGKGGPPEAMSTTDPNTTFQTLIDEIRAKGITRWEEVQDAFLSATGTFDAEYRTGLRPQGWYQSKARYFNDIVVSLVENASGATFGTRVKVKSVLYQKVDLDICYPAVGRPLIAAEVKQLGTPPHPGNQDRDRGGSNDLHKRSREVAIASVDIKNAYADPIPIRSFSNWIDRTEPGYFSFWAIRVKDQADLQRVRDILVSLRSYSNGVGAVLYRPIAADALTTYESVQAHPLDVDVVIREIAQRVARPRNT